MDKINEIIKQLDERGLVYIRLYNSKRVDRLKSANRGWVAKCVRQRGGNAVTISAHSTGEPVEAFEALLLAINTEADRYLTSLRNSTEE